MIKIIRNVFNYIVVIILCQQVLNSNISVVTMYVYKFELVQSSAGPHGWQVLYAIFV